MACEVGSAIEVGETTNVLYSRTGSRNPRQLSDAGSIGHVGDAASVGGESQKAILMSTFQLLRKYPCVSIE